MPARLERVAFRTSRLLDFASEKELTAQVGHRRASWPLVLLKELVDNSLDACEDAGVAPEVKVTVDKAGILVEDNGPGIPPETVEGVLDFSVRVSSREAYVSPTRGAQGNALKTILTMPFVLDGERGRVEITARGIRHEIALEVDRIRQEPRVSHEARPDRLVKNGTSVRVAWPSSACSVLEAAKTRFLQLGEDYAWLNPHLTLSVEWQGERTALEAIAPGWKKWLPSTPTSAHWYDPERLERLIAAYIAHDEERGADRTVREFVSEFHGLSATAKQKALLEATGLQRVGLSTLRNGNGLDRGAVDRLLRAMKERSKVLKPVALGALGRENLALRFEKGGSEMKSFNYKRTAGEQDGAPWLLEVAFAWAPKRRERRFIPGVNWSPGILNPFRELGHLGRSLDSVLEEQRVGRREPVIFLLHIAHPRVEYTDRGKSAVVIEGADAAEDEA